ncbi:MAG: DUF6261 family protein [Bacteroidales bacterium]|jgi:hypothetical protein|nr:DUF6261 family protein [Bacteroidales bacterium]
MKVKIERIPYARLRNDEFPVVYGQTIGICGRYDMNGLHLGKSYGELLTFRPTLESLTVYLRKNEKLALAGKIDVERDALIGAVNRVVKGYENIDLPELAQHFDLLNALLEKHRSRTIASDSRAAETKRLQTLENEVKADAAVQGAFAAFGLTPVVARLFAANREYDELFLQYLAETSEEPQINVRQLRQECTKALTQFFDAVQYSAYEHEELDYMPLIHQLVKLNQYYNRQLNARLTRRKNGKKTDEEPAIPPMESEN